jgi:DNA-binding response OmpR family regulator
VNPPLLARVLLAEESLSYRRVIREALTYFRLCEVDECSTAERAFELALARPYALMILAIPLPDMSGQLLDRFITRAYPLAHAGAHTAPPVLYISKPEEVAELEVLKRDVRVRGWFTYPPRLDTLLNLTTGLLPDAGRSLA